jgi:hypothetical protein
MISDGRQKRRGKDQIDMAGRCREWSTGYVSEEMEANDK